MVMTAPNPAPEVLCPCCGTANVHPQILPRRTEKKASIDELEKILNAPEGQYKINIRPDGSVDVYTLSECKDCGCVWDESKAKRTPAPSALPDGVVETLRFVQDDILPKMRAYADGDQRETVEYIEAAAKLARILAPKALPVHSPNCPATWDTILQPSSRECDCGAREALSLIAQPQARTIIGTDDTPLVQPCPHCDKPIIVNANQRAQKFDIERPTDSRPCLHPIHGTTCGYPESACMHEGSTYPKPPAGRHKYQPEPK